MIVLNIYFIFLIVKFVIKVTTKQSIWQIYNSLEFFFFSRCDVF